MLNRIHPRLSSVLSDTFAGTVVFLVALPLCLGIATASGATPVAGLVTGIIGGLIVALLSGSRLSVSGPAAGLVVIVLSSVASLGSFSAFLAAVFIAGVIQVVLGLLRAGHYARIVPLPVVKGMLAGIGILLIFQQIPLVTGLLLEARAASGPDSSVSAAAHVATPFGDVSVIATLLAVFSVAFLFAWETEAAKRFMLTRLIPGQLAVVIIGIAVTFLFTYFASPFALPSEHLVALAPITSLEQLQSILIMPDFTQLLSADVWRVAIVLAIVASLETLLSLEAIEQLDPKRQRASPNRELKAQGLGNMCAAMLGGLPMTSVIVRSTANLNAGAQTRLSAMVHGALLLLSVFALTSVLNLIPLASLGAILIHTGYKLAKPQLFMSMAREGRDRMLPFATTIVGIIATDLLTGIGIGVATAALLALRANLTKTFSLNRHDDHFLLRFRKDVSFFSKATLEKLLMSIPNRSYLIIDAERADNIDRDVREMIETFIAEAPMRHISVNKERWPDGLPLTEHSRNLAPAASGIRFSDKKIAREKIQRIEAGF